MNDEKQIEQIGLRIPIDHLALIIRAAKQLGLTRNAFIIHSTVVNARKIIESSQPEG